MNQDVWQKMITMSVDRYGFEFPRSNLPPQPAPFFARQIEDGTLRTQDAARFQKFDCLVVVHPFYI